MIVSGNFAKALYPGVSKWYGTSYDEHKVEWTDLFDDNSSKRAFEEEVGTSGFGLAVKKREANGITYDDARQAFITRYSHVVYGLGFTISKEAMEDDLYDVVGKLKAQSLAFSLRQTREINSANVYNRAFNSSYVGGDGVELCSTVHPNFAGGTWSNEPSTAVDLSEAALESACISIMKWTNDRGLKISVMPQCLVIPVDLVFNAERILKTPMRVNTADNDINALYSMGKFPGGIKSNHYLTDTNAWFIRTNVPDGMKSFTRRSASFDIDNSFDNEVAKFKATERYSQGWTNPRGIYGSQGA